MKKNYLLVILLFIVHAIGAIGNKPIGPDLKSTATDFIKNKPVRFVENKGQMTDMNNNPVPFVLFKAEAPGVIVYITDKGITYNFIKAEEEDASTPPALSPSATLRAGGAEGLSVKKEDNEMEKEKGSFMPGQQERIRVEWERVDMELKDAVIKKENFIKQGEGISDLNFFYPHCSEGIYGVKEYEKITIKDIYPGIDWVLYNSGKGGFKYDFIAHPGSDWKKINMVWFSKKPIQLKDDGSLDIVSRYGHLGEKAPVSFYKGETVKTKFKKQYEKKILKNEDKGYETSIVFSLENEFPVMSDLTIDPVLWWATFYGGNIVDGPMSVDNDTNDNIFIAGYLSSPDFPVMNSGSYFQGKAAATFDGDLFIQKFNNTGTLLWATYYGGNANETANSIALDASGNVFVTGLTSSTNFPVQNAGTYFQATGNGDAFILKFNNTGVRSWATYFGGATSSDCAFSIAIDIAGNIFVAGYATVADFPVLNAGTYYQAVSAGGVDLFISKFSNSGVLLWSTYYGGSGADYGYSIDIDANGNIFITGRTTSADFPVLSGGTFFQGTNAGGANDIFIIKFSNTGVLLWATYYGGNGDDQGYTVLVDATGNIFLTGPTSSTNFPVLTAGTFFQGALAGGVYDAFILKFTNAGTRLWATYLGGNKNEYPSISLCTYDNLVNTSCGDVYASFNTASTILPFKTPCDGGYVDHTYNGGNSDVFLILFSNSGALLWSTYIGGNDKEFREALALDSKDDLFMAGEWAGFGVNSATYPVTNPGGTTYFDATFNTGSGLDDEFILKFVQTPASITPSQVNSSVCNPCNGSATVTVNNVCPPYNFVWSNGTSSMNVTGNSNTITGLCAGTYSVSVSSSCTTQTFSETYSITGFDCNTCDLAGQFTKGTTTCTGCGCKQWIMVNARGGTSPYSYSWPDGYDKRYKNSLCPGAYNVKITDGNGCTVNLNINAP